MQFVSAKCYLFAARLKVTDASFPCPGWEVGEYSERVESRLHAGQAPAAEPFLPSTSLPFANTAS